MKGHICSSGIIFLVLVIFINTSLEQKQSQSLSLDYSMANDEELVALDKFRKMMSPYLLTSYMKENVYLIRWLRAKDLNLEEAEEMLLENLLWRKENKIDSIINEDFSDMAEDYVYKNDGYDRKGRPVGFVNLGNWNVLAAALSGKMPRLTRYMTKLLEQSSQKIIDAQYAGKNVTKFKIIMNLDNFNGIEHTCPVCMPLYISFVTTTQNYYAGYPHRIVLINTPVVFKAVLDIITPLFTPGTKKVLRIYGNDRKQWMAYLDKEISRDQRRPEFGGTKKD